MKKTFIIIFSVLIIIFSFWFFYLKNEKENRLTKQSNDVISMIERYKDSNRRLPNTLNDIGIKIVDESTPPIYYEKKDSINYAVWFATSGESIKIYYSDTKKWHDNPR